MPHRLFSKILPAIVVAFSLFAACKQIPAYRPPAFFCDTCDYAIYKSILASDSELLQQADYSDLNAIKNRPLPICDRFKEDIDTSSYFKDSSITKQFEVNELRSYSQYIPITFQRMKKEQLKELADYVISGDSIKVRYAQKKYLTYLIFSRPLLSADRRYALVEMDRNCFGLCGEGCTYLLKKEGDDWIVVKKTMRWIS